MECTTTEEVDMTTARTQGSPMSPTKSLETSGPGRPINDQRRIGWFMAGPAVVLLVGFLIVPFFMAFYLSFTNQRLISPNPAEAVGWTNFARLLTVKTTVVDPVVDESGAPVLGPEGELTYPRARELTRNNPDLPELAGLQEWTTLPWAGDSRLYLLARDAVFMRALVNTIIFAVVIAPVQGGLGLVLALLVNRRTRAVNVFRAIYFMPVVMSMVVVALLWRFIYSPTSGLFNNILSAISFGLIEPVDWLGNPSTALAAIIAMSVWQGVGFHMIIWLSGLQTIPGYLYEAASIDGATSFDQFKHVTWPGLRNVAVFVLITITIAAFGLFTQVDVMTRGGPLDSTQTVVYQAVINGFESQDIAYGSAISVVFFLIVLAVALVQRYLTREAD
jgi:multiple sugar transport system permease protein